MQVPAHVVKASSDVDKIVANARLDHEDRQRLISTRRAVALADHLVVALGQARDVVLDGWSVHIEDAFINAATNAVELHGVVVLDPQGQDVGIDPHRLYVNPPLLFPDPNGNIDRGERGKFRVDPAAVILDAILHAAKQSAQ